MKITVKRIADNGDATIGVLYIDGVFHCFTIEDQEQKGDKVMHETRIPNGTYKIALRNAGGFSDRYAKKYEEIHEGMLCIYNAPEWKIEANGKSFQYILIHTGNTDDHTSGCLLLNDAVSGSTFSGSSSVNAYKRIYPIIRDAVKTCEVEITYIDIEEGK